MIQAPGVTRGFVTRRRLVQYVNLGVRDLLPPTEAGQWRRDPEAGQLSVVTSMRLRHDFGTYQRWAVGDAGSLVGGIDGRQIDLLYAYLRGDRIARWADFRIGRQFEFSGLDWYAFDGAWVRLRSPAHVAFEVFGGIEVDGAAPFGYSRHELDGTALDATELKRSPMFGVAVATEGLGRLDARLAYRGTFSPPGLGREALEDRIGDAQRGAVDQEIVSATTALRLAHGRLVPYAAGRFNLGTARVDDVDAGVAWRVTPQHTVRGNYYRSLPAFDLDSVFSVFAMNAIEDARMSLDMRLAPQWRGYGRVQLRILRGGEADDPLSGVDLGYGGGLGLAYGGRVWMARFDAHAVTGVGGLRAGARATTRWWPTGRRLSLDGRLYGMHYADEATEDRHGYSVAAQAGANLRVWGGLSVHVVGEEMLTPFVKNAFRLLAVLSVDWSLRVGAR